MNTVHESMTFWFGARWKVRIWGKEPGLNPGPVPEFMDALDGLERESTLADVAALLDGFDAISAYEVVDFDGQGVCVYRDWP